MGDKKTIRLDIWETATDVTRRCAITVLVFFGSLLATSAQTEYSIRTFGIRDGLACNNISGMQQDSRGLMWIATYNGLCCYDGYQFTTFGKLVGGDTLPTNRIAKIKVDSADNIYLRTYSGDVYLYDTHSSRYKRIDEDTDTPLNHTTPEETRANTTAGMGWRMTDDRQLLVGDGPAAKAVPGIITGYKHYADRQGNLWLTSPHGLTLVNFRRQNVRMMPVVAGQPTRSVLCRKDGTVWAGSYDGFIAVLDGSGQQAGWLQPGGTIGSRQVRFADHVYALFEDSRGTLWIGTKGMGAYTLSPNGRLSHYTADSSDPYAISHNDIYDFCEDALGNVWIATFGGGLNVVNVSVSNGGTGAGGAAAGTGDRVRFLHSGNSMPLYPKEDFRKVRRITRTADGTMLASTTSGLMVFRPAKDSNGTSSPNTSSPSPLASLQFFTTTHRHGDAASLRTNDVLQTLVCHDGSILTTTMGGSVQRIIDSNLKHDNLKLEAISQLSRSMGNVQALAEDADGNIWANREIIIECYQPQTGNLLQYDYLSHNTEMSEAKPSMDVSGRLWMGVTGGVISFLPQDMRKSTFCPNIIFTNLQYNGEQNVLPIIHQQTVDIVDREQRSLTISFAALDYSYNYLLQYAYRMDDDKQWNNMGRTPRIVFNRLSPGRHVLTVRSTNSDGVWCDNDTRLVIDVRPMWWERSWVQVLLMLLTVALSTWSVMAWLRRRQRNREREQRLESILRQYRQLQQQMSEMSETPQDVLSPAAEAHHYTLKEPKIVDADEDMMQKLMAYIEGRISDEDLKIDDMAGAVGLGRTVFYEKVKSLVGVSPIDFLRQLRMQRAQQLLSRSTMNISEVAYSVGFTDPKYFSRCFKKDTGMSPREYRESATSVTTSVNAF